MAHDEIRQLRGGHAGQGGGRYASCLRLQVLDFERGEAVDFNLFLAHVPTVGGVEKGNDHQVSSDVFQGDRAQLTESSVTKPRQRQRTGAGIFIVHPGQAAIPRENRVEGAAVAVDRVPILQTVLAEFLRTVDEAQAETGRGGGRACSVIGCLDSEQGMGVARDGQFQDGWRESGPVGRAEVLGRNLAVIDDAISGQGWRASRRGDQAGDGQVHTAGGNRST